MNALVSLRRGAWYPVLSAGVEEAVLEVHGASTILARDLVEIVHERPQMWSVVPPEWGGPYLVCPDCAERVRDAATAGPFSLPPLRRVVCGCVGTEYRVDLLCPPAG